MVHPKCVYLYTQIMSQNTYYLIVTLIVIDSNLVILSQNK